jgi:hypothetical protein
MRASLQAAPSDQELVTLCLKSELQKASSLDKKARRTERINSQVAKMVLVIVI